MEPLIEFSLPVRGMRAGVHHYDFQVNAAFFKHFEHSLVEHGGEFEVKVDIDKRVDLMTCSIQFEGSMATTCDRCLADIHLPVSGFGDMIFKFVEGADGEEDENDESVVYISPYASKLNLAGYIHEFISLAVPISRVYDCEFDDPRPCDTEMLAFLENGGHNSANRQDDDDDNDDNPFRDALKNLKR